jgi:hypothetical protein
MVRVGWYFTRLSHSSHSSFRGAGHDHYRRDAVFGEVLAAAVLKDLRSSVRKYAGEVDFMNSFALPNATNHIWADVKTPPLESMNRNAA